MPDGLHGQWSCERVQCQVVRVLFEGKPKLMYGAVHGIHFVEAIRDREQRLLDFLEPPVLSCRRLCSRSPPYSSR